jgi:hypothetical protein
MRMLVKKLKSVRTPKKGRTLRMIKLCTKMSREQHLHSIARIQIGRVITYISKNGGRTRNLGKTWQRRLKRRRRHTKAIRKKK